MHQFEINILIIVAIHGWNLLESTGTVLGGGGGGGILHKTPYRMISQRLDDPRSVLRFFQSH